MICFLFIKWERQRDTAVSELGGGVGEADGVERNNVKGVLLR